MRRKLNSRAHTQSNVSIMNLSSLKVQGKIYISSKSDNNSKSLIIEVKPQNKILYNCYKRYKTFSFNFDQVYKQQGKQQFYDTCFKFQAWHALMSNLNYMVCFFGQAQQQELQKQLSIVQDTIFKQLCTVFDKLIKQNICTWKLTSIAVTQQQIYDLKQGKKVVEIKKTNENKNNYDYNSSLPLIQSSHSFPQTQYQIVNVIKQARLKRQAMQMPTYLVIMAQIQSPETQKKKYNLMFIDATKKQNNDKNWDNGSMLVLNKCILALLHRQENNKQAYVPFRDSKLTKLMRPFLAGDSKVDVVGIISHQDEQNSLSTLNLIKNLSKIKVPLAFQIANKKQEQSLITKKSQQLITSESEQNKHTKNAKILFVKQNASPKSSQKLNLIQKIKQNAKQQQQSLRKISKIRLQMKMMIKRKQINIPGINLNQNSRILEQLQNQQAQFIQKSQKQAIAQNQDINKKRIQLINSSPSKVQKLQMLKEYYNSAILNQKQEKEEFLKNQSIIFKFYEEKLKVIDKNLKKSPSQFLDESPNYKSKSEKKSRSESRSQYEKHSLPFIEERNKRAKVIKQKVKKGRVDYQDFLSKNVSQYKSYSTAIDK